MERLIAPQTMLSQNSKGRVAADAAAFWLPPRTVSALLKIFWLLSVVAAFRSVVVILWLGAGAGAPVAALVPIVLLDDDGIVCCARSPLPFVGLEQSDDSKSCSSVVVSGNSVVVSWLRL